MSTKLGRNPFENKKKPFVVTDYITPAPDLKQKQRNEVRESRAQATSVDGSWSEWLLTDVPAGAFVLGLKALMLIQ